MSTPLVYLEPSVARQAARLAPGVVVENAIANAIRRGDVRSGTAGGIVFLDELGLVARCERRAGRLRERPRQWFVVSVKPKEESNVSGAG